MLLPRLIVLIFCCVFFSCDGVNETIKKSNKIPAPDTKNTLPQIVADIDTTKYQIPASRKSIHITSVTTSLYDDLESVDQSFQSFFIDQHSDTTLYGSEGTILTIKKMSFLFEDTREKATGVMEIKIKEWYKPSDIILAGLSTQSGEHILETGGMVYIEAYSEGRKCILAEDRTIGIVFPCEIRKKDMQLFTGKKNKRDIDWIPLAKPVLQPIVEEAAEFPGRSGLQYFLKKHLRYPDSLIGNNARVIVDFVINERGAATSVSIKDTIEQGFRDMIFRAFSNMPVWKPAKRNGIPVQSTFSLSIIFGDQTDDLAYKRRFEATVNDTTLSGLRSSEMSRYVFSSSKLGWINCDRFINLEKPATDLYVSCGNYSEIDIKLVFHSFKSFLNGELSGTTCKFKGVPANEKITIVVIKKMDNNAFVSLMESNTSMQEINNLRFEKVTMDKLKEKLEQLNNAPEPYYK
jgi:hypothetical protein